MKWTKTRGAAWLIVAGMALALSWWSLFQLARHYGVPTPLAAGVSLVFDAAALVCAGLAHRYALSPDSGAGPRVTLVMLLGGSVYLNWTHAELTGYGTPAAVMFAAPAAVAVVLFELETAWTTRAGRRDRGRVAPALPVVGRWTWIFHPARSFRTLWLVSAAQADAVRAVELVRWRRVAREAGHLDRPPFGQLPVTLTGSPPAGAQSDRPSEPTMRALAEPAQAGSSDTATQSASREQQGEQVGPAAQPTLAEPTEELTGATGRLPQLDDDVTRTLLGQMRSDAERVRFAAHAVGSDVRAVGAYLSEHGHPVKPETIRTALRRVRGSRATSSGVVPISDRRSA